MNAGNWGLVGLVVICVLLVVAARIINKRDVRRIDAETAQLVGVHDAWEAGLTQLPMNRIPPHTEEELYARAHPPIIIQNPDPELTRYFLEKDKHLKYMRPLVKEEFDFDRNMVRWVETPEFSAMMAPLREARSKRPFFTDVETFEDEHGFGWTGTMTEDGKEFARGMYYGHDDLISGIQADMRRMLAEEEKLAAALTHKHQWKFLYPVENSAPGRWLMYQCKVCNDTTVIREWEFWGWPQYLYLLPNYRGPLKVRAKLDTRKLRMRPNPWAEPV